MAPSHPFRRKEWLRGLNEEKEPPAALEYKWEWIVSPAILDRFFTTFRMPCFWSLLTFKRSFDCAALRSG
jgi:hypothetical protein